MAFFIPENVGFRSLCACSSSKRKSNVSKSQPWYRTLKCSRKPKLILPHDQRNWIFFQGILFIGFLQERAKDEVVWLSRLVVFFQCFSVHSIVYMCLKSCSTFSRAWQVHCYSPVNRVVSRWLLATRRKFMFSSKQFPRR